MTDENAVDGEIEIPERFLFETSFDVEQQDEVETEAEPEEPPEPTFTLLQVEEARKQGYAEGRRDGSEEASKAIEAETRQLLEAMGQALPRISEAQSAANDRLSRQAAEVAAAIARKLMPALLERNGSAEIEALVEQCLQYLIEQPKISVRVGARHAEAIEAHLRTMAEATGFDGRFVVEPDDAMGPADCRIRWAGGGMERSADAVWQEIEASVARYVSSLDETAEPAEEPAEPAEPATPEQRDEDTETGLAAATEESVEPLQAAENTETEHAHAAEEAEESSGSPAADIAAPDSDPASDETVMTSAAAITDTPTEEGGAAEPEPLPDPETAPEKTEDRAETGAPA